MPEKTPDPLESIEQRDREWLEKVYRGDKEKELTPRAVIAGMAFGGLMSLSNLYVGLKSGWGLGVDIAAVVVIFTVFKALRGVGLVKREFGILENTMMMSTAVAASWMSSAGLVSSVPALTMLTGYTFVWWQLSLFIGSILLLGLCMAIPLKRQMIQVDALKFPGNVPTGETLKAIYASGEEGIKKAKAMGIAGAIGVVLAALRDLFNLIPGMLTVPGHIGRIGLGKLTMTFEPSLIFVGIGAVFGIRIGMSMLIGLILNYGVLAPVMINRTEIKHAAPEIKAVAAPQFPLAVNANDTFSAMLVEMTTEPEINSDAVTNLICYTWNRPTIYNNLAELQRDFSAPTLQDGSLNPFAKLAVFDTFTNKLADAVMLSLKSLLATNWEATLIIPASKPTAVAAALGFQGSPLFTSKDFLHLNSLALKLKHPGDPISTYLNSQLSKAGHLSLGSYQEGAYSTNNLEQTALAAVELVLTEDLNTILEKKSLYSESRFAGIHLRETTKAQLKIKKNLEGEGLMRLNRSLLEDAFPSELSRERFHKNASNKQNIGGFRNIVAWSLWPGATILVVGGLLALAFQWRTLGRTFGDIFASFGNKQNRPRGVLAHLEIPMTWFAIGFFVMGLIAIGLLVWLFGIHWWMGLIAVVMTFFLAAVATRAGAETSVNPIGAMGKVTQLTYGVLAPGNIPANLMTAGVTAGSACSCCDTIGNLKVGHMVGASPRKQFVAQMFGVVAGAMIAVPAYLLLVPDPNALGGEKFPAPSALIWKGVAQVLSQGLHTLPHTAVVGVLVAFIAAVIIVVVERIFPKTRPYMLSPTALGIAMTIPAYTSFSMFLGALIAWILEKTAPKWSERFTIAIASGCIAGESIAGVGILAINTILGR